MFTGESKYGYQDGEHFANWGDGYPLFVRVVNGQVYVVAREENPNAGNRFFHMYTMSREWLKNTIFAGTPTDADLFVDKPNTVEDSSIPANQFIKSADTSQLLKRPNSAATVIPPVTPAVVPPSTTTGNPQNIPATTTPATTPPPTTTGSNAIPTSNLPINLSTATGGATKSTPNWLVIALVSLAVIAVVGVIFWKKK